MMRGSKQHVWVRVREDDIARTVRNGRTEDTDGLACGVRVM